MKFYFKQHSDINCINGMTESTHLKPSYPDSVHFQGHTYSLHTVYVRKLGISKQLIAFFECLATIVLSLGKSLSNADFREKWTSVFEGRIISVIYLLDNQTTDTSAEKTEQIEDPLKDPLQEKISKTENITSKQNSSQIDLSDLFKRFPDGMNTSLLTSGDRDLLSQFVQKWENRSPLDKFSWTQHELADLWSIDKKDCPKLLYFLMGLDISRAHLPLNTIHLSKFFMDLKGFI